MYQIAKSIHMTLTETIELNRRDSQIVICSSLTGHIIKEKSV